MLPLDPRQATRLGRWFTVMGIMLMAAFVAVTVADDSKTTPKADPQDKAKTDVQGDPLPPGARARLGTLRWRHADNVTYVAYAQDGKAVLTASQDNILRLWDRETGKEIRRFVGPTNPNPNPLQPGGMVAWGIIGRGQSAVALSRDGKILAAAFQNKGIHLWDVNTGKELPLIKGPANGVNALLFAPDGKILVARGNDRTTYLLDTETGKELRQIKIQQKQPGGGVVILNIGGIGGGGMAISPDGKTLVTGEMEFNQGKVTTYVKLSEMETGKEIRKIDTSPDGISGIAYSPNGKILAFGSGNNVQLREADSDKEIRKINSPGGVTALAFAHDGKTLAAKGRDQVIRLWETDTGKEIHKLGEPAPGLGNNGAIILGLGLAEARDFAFSPDGKVVAAGAGQTLRLWDAATGKELPLTGGGHRGPVSGLVISPDGKTLVSRGADNVIRRWDAATGNELGQFQAPPGTSAVAFAPDGKTVALGVADVTIHLVDAVSGKALQKLKGHINGTTNLVFSPNGKVLASRGRADNIIRLHEVANGGTLKEIPLPGEKMPVGPGGGFGVGGMGGQAVAFSPDGQTVVAHIAANPVIFRIQNQPAPAPAEDTLHMWDVSTGKEIRKITLPQRGMVSMAFAPDGRILAIENADQSISLLEIASGKERDRLGKSDQVPKPQPTIYGNFARPATASVTLAYSPDGSLLAAKAPGHTVRVWEVSATKVIGLFKGHDGAVQTVAFAPDGKSLATGSNDTTILIWDVANLKRTSPLPAVELQAKEVESLWADLAGDDGRRAGQSILRLATAPKQTTPFLRDRLKPVVPIDPKILDQLIADLDSDNFQVRSKASEGLSKLNELAVPALRKVLASQPSLESRRRAESLLEKLTGGILTGEQIRLVRAVEVLEKLGTAESRQVLKALASGAPGALPTRQAQAVLDRHAGK